MVSKIKSTDLAYGYVRLSPRDKNDQRLSVNVQCDEIRAYCVMRHLPLVSLFIDVDVSGATDLAARPQGNKLVTTLLLQPGFVVSTRQDRLFRDSADALATIKKWRPFGITPVCIAEGLDLSTPAGRLMFTMLAGYAQYEREVIGERTRAVLQAKKARGERVSRTMPYGWDEGPDGTASKNLTEQYWLRWMKNMRSRGHSDRTIAKQLNEKKAPTKTGSIWRHATVAQILDREGCARPDVCPPDVTAEDIEDGMIGTREDADQGAVGNEPPTEEK